MFLQIHTLTSYHAALLNRDDAGLAKRIPFGDATRVRVSSQCLKRHWRMALARQVDLPGAIRTRHFFGREVFDRLVHEKGMDPELARRLVRVLAKALLSSRDSKDPLDENLQMKQPALFGRPEADFIVGLLHDSTQSTNPEESLREQLKTDKKNWQAMVDQAGHGHLFAGIEGALFGRFVTSDILSRSDAAVHVAHAFTVHAEDNEVDYFTVVDDLGLDEETGAAHAGDMDLGSGIFYGYVAVDIPLLVSNFHGCDQANWAKQDVAGVADTLTTLARVIATTSPGAKLGSTAPYAYADLMILEAGRDQPRSLANAFLRAVTPRGDVVGQAADRLATHLDALEAMYGQTAERRYVSATVSWPGKETVVPLDEAAREAMDFIVNAGV